MDIFKLFGTIIINSEEANETINTTAANAGALRETLTKVGKTADDASKKLGAGSPFASACTWLGTALTKSTAAAGRLGQRIAPAAAADGAWGGQSQPYGQTPTSTPSAYTGYIPPSVPSALSAVESSPIAASQPYSVLGQYRNAADTRNGAGSSTDVSRIEAGIAQLVALLGQIAGNTGAGSQVVLDSGALVGQLISRIDAGLGGMVARKRRA